MLPVSMLSPGKCLHLKKFGDEPASEICLRGCSCGLKAQLNLAAGKWNHGCVTITHPHSRGGGKEDSHMFHSWAFLRPKGCARSLLTPSSCPLQSPRRTRAVTTAPGLVCLTASGQTQHFLFFSFFLLRTALPPQRTLGSCSACDRSLGGRLGSGLGEPFAYGCARHYLSCGCRGVSLREESGSVFVPPAVWVHDISCRISVCGRRGQWIAPPHSPRHRFQVAEFAPLMDFYYRWKQDGATKELWTLEPWWNKDKKSFPQVEILTPMG